jgi:hypothetical protein
VGRAAPFAIVPMPIGQPSRDASTTTRTLTTMVAAPKDIPVRSATP